MFNLIIKKTKYSIKKISSGAYSFLQLSLLFHKWSWTLCNPHKHQIDLLWVFLQVKNASSKFYTKIDKSHLHIDQNLF
jgi:hypothetical protein